MRTLMGHSEDIYAVCFSPDDTHVASGSGDHHVIIWNAETGAKVSSHRG